MPQLMLSHSTDSGKRFMLIACIVILRFACALQCVNTACACDGNFNIITVNLVLPKMHIISQIFKLRAADKIELRIRIVVHIGHKQCNPFAISIDYRPGTCKSA